MNSIRVSDRDVELKLSVFVYLDQNHPDGDVYVAYCPELDLAGSGHGEKEARDSFEWVMKDYLDDMLSQGTLESDLIQHGWKKAKNGEIKEPSWPTLMRSRRMSDIFRQERFTKYSMPFTV